MFTCPHKPLCTQIKTKDSHESCRNSGFIANSADYDGAGVYMWYSNVSFGDSEFSDNCAEWCGGGVYVEESTVNLGDKSALQ